MKKCLTVLLAVLFIFATAMLNAQVVTERSCVKKLQEERSSILLDPATVMLPGADTLGLSAKRNSGKNSSLPQFAVAIPVDLNMENSGRWTESEEGTRMWILDLISKDAKTMHLRFAKFHIAEGASLRIYNHAGTMVQGPFTSDMNSEKQTIATDLMEGDGIRLVYTEPAFMAEKSELFIQKVFHGYLDLFSKEGIYAKYNFPLGIGLEDAKVSDATALVIVGDTRLCAGFLVNNPVNDFTPYFVTTFSALDVAGFDQTSDDYQDGVLQGYEICDAENLQFRFKFVRDGQDPTANGAWITYNSCKVKSTWQESDLVLLQLNRRPAGAANISYLGWNAAEGITALEGLKVNGEILEKGNKAILPGSPCLSASGRLVGYVKGAGFNGMAEKVGNLKQLTRLPDFGENALNMDGTLVEPLLPPISPLYISPNPKLICSGGSATFTLQNYPAGGYTANWSTSSNLSITSGQNSGSLTVTATGNGAGWVDATIYDNWGNLIAKQPSMVKVWVGPPTVVSVGTPSLYRSTPFSTEVKISAIVSSSYPLNDITYSWVVCNGTIISGQGTRTITVQIDCAQEHFCAYIVASNSCSSYTTPCRAFETSQYCCPLAPSAPYLYSMIPLMSAFGSATYDVAPQWSQSTNAAKYIVYRSTNQITWNHVCTIYDPNTTTCFDRGLPCGTRYWYKVVAVNSCNVRTTSNYQNIIIWCDSFEDPRDYIE